MNVLKYRRAKMRSASVNQDGITTALVEFAKVIKTVIDADR